MKIGMHIAALCTIFVASCSETLHPDVRQRLQLMIATYAHDLEARAPRVDATPQQPYINVNPELYNARDLYLRNLVVTGSLVAPIIIGGPYVLKAGDTMSGDLIMLNQQGVQFSESALNGTNAITVQAPATTAIYTFQLPSGPGTGNYVLTTDGTGVTSWAPVSAVGATGITMLNGLTTSTQYFANGYAGIEPKFNSLNNTHTLNIPLASTYGVLAGLITSTDYYNFSRTYTMVLAGTPFDIPNTLVLRDNTGSFAATTITVTGAVIFQASNGNMVAMIPVDKTSTYTFVLPPNGGTSGYVLTTDGTGVTNWEPGGSGGSGGITDLNNLTTTTQFFANGYAGIQPAFNSLNNTHTLNIPLASTYGVLAGLISSTDYYNFSKTYTTVATGTPLDIPNTLVLRDNTGSFAATHVSLQAANTNQVTLAPQAGTSGYTFQLPPDGGTSGYVLETDGTGITSWVAVSAAGASGITELNNLTTTTQYFANGYAGIQPAFNSLNNTHTLNIPLASTYGVLAGLISSTDYYNFSRTYTTVLAGTPLNIPNTLVLRDGTGSFAAQNITAATIETCSLVSTCTYLLLEIDGTGTTYQLIVQPDTSIQPSLELAVTGTISNISLELLVHGDSAVYALSDAPVDPITFSSINVAGNPRGAGAVDLQLFRADPTNVASGIISSLLGGINNTASGQASSVVGGNSNQATNLNSIVAGGTNNIASGLISGVFSGQGNIASGNFATVLGGLSNTANGSVGIAAGQLARAAHSNSFVWSDGSTLYGSPYTSQGPQTFNIQATGGAFFDSNMTTTGSLTFLAPNNNTVTIVPNPATSPSYPFQLPSGPGVFNYVLTTDGTGITSWAPVGAVGASGITQLNGLTTTTQYFANGYAGIEPKFNSAINTHTLNIPLASSYGVLAGLISSTDYYNFRNTYTTVLAGTPLNIPNTLVKRDGTGSFAAQNITAATIETCSLVASCTYLLIEVAGTGTPYQLVLQPDTSIQPSMQLATRSPSLPDVSLELVLQGSGAFYIWNNTNDETFLLPILTGTTRGAYAVDLQTVRTNPLFVASGLASSLVGGLNNLAAGEGSSVLGGSAHQAYGLASSIVGGQVNTVDVNGAQGGILAGYLNYVNGEFAVVLGGSNNQATGTNAVAAGHRAQATDNNSFVWADHSGYTSQGVNTFTISAAGGAYVNANINTTGVINFTAPDAQVVTLQPNPSTSAYTFQLPANGGTNGYVLTTDGTGVTHWAVGGSGGGGAQGITDLNNLTTTTQFFANGYAGIEPKFNSAINTHTLNIPLASTYGVLAGLITSTDYYNLKNTYTTVLAGTPLNIPNTLVLRDGTGSFAAQNITAASIETCSLVSTCSYLLIQVGDPYQVVVLPDASVQPTMQLVLDGDQPNISLEFITHGEGALYASSDAVTEGASRGSYTVDLQLYRTNSNNRAAASYSALIAGADNIVVDDFSGVFCGQVNSIYDSTSVILGGASNSVLGGGSQSAIVGGYANEVGDTQSAIIAGIENVIYVGGGAGNVIAGGQENTLSGPGSLNGILGGYDNTINASGSVILGGSGNSITGDYSGVLAGQTNTASGQASVVLGGVNNVASGSNAIAAGYNTLAANADSFVWAGFHSGTYESNAGSSFNVNALGGAYFDANIYTTGDVTFQTTGNAVTLAPASGTAAYTFQLPPNAGTANYVLSTDGSGITSWKSVSAISASGIVQLNGLITTTQYFANGYAGTYPLFNSVMSTHTLNIPMASSYAVLAGLISSTDYYNFKNTYTTIQAGTSFDIPNTLVLRDNTGSFASTNITVTGAVKFLATNGNTLTLASNPATSPSYTFQLPANGGSPNYVLSTNGSGVTTWQPVGDIAQGIMQLNGLTTTTQYFANGYAGIQPIFNSLNNTHTLNIPLASSYGVLAGLITSTDYYNFRNTYTTINAGTPLDIPNRLVLRDNTGSFAATTLTVTGAVIFQTATNAVTMIPASGTSAYTFQLPANGGTNGYYLATNGSGVTTWSAINIPAQGITDLNNLTTTTQFFANGYAGIQPIFNSLNNTHTLNIPLASSYGVLAGLITSTDYYNFRNTYTTINAGTALDIPNRLVLRSNTGSFAATTITVTGGTIFQAPNGSIVTMLPNSLTTTYTFKLPQSPIAGDVLTTDALGNTSWVAVGSLGSSITTITGDTGYITGSAVSIKANATAGSSVTFVGNDAQAMVFNVTDASQNTLIGQGAGNASAVGLGAQQNVALGYQALSSVQGGLQNVAVGYQALRSLQGSGGVLGVDNTAVGYQAGMSVTSGSSNTYLGVAGGNNGTGNANVVIGIAGNAVGATYSNCTIVGTNAATGLTSGNANTFVGQGAGSTITTGSGNIVIGYNAQTNASTSSAVVIGPNSLATALNAIAIGSSASAGTSSVAIGASAMGSSGGGGNNIAIGSVAGFGITSGGNNIAIGSSAGVGMTSGGSNIAIGSSAGQLIAGGTGNICVGGLAGESISSTNYHTIVGYGSGKNISTGYYNTIVGANSGNSYTSGIETSNVIIGQAIPGKAGESNAVRIGNSTGSGVVNIANSYLDDGSAAIFIGRTNGVNTYTAGTSIVALGDGAANSITTGGQNTIIGNNAGASLQTAASNTFVGYNAGHLATAAGNTFVGASAGAAVTSGAQNTLVGSAAGTALVTGTGNTIIGFTAGSTITGSANTLIGSLAGLGLTTGSDNIVIGAGSAPTITTGSHNIIIGNAPTDGGAGTSNTIFIGIDDQIVGCNIGGIRGVTTGIADAVAVLIASNGQLGQTSSLRKLKDNIRPMGDFSSAIMELEPVIFNYKVYSPETVTPGLIAEDVYEIMPRLVAKNKDGEVETVKYHELPALLLNELQKVYQRVNEHEELIKTLQEQIKVLMNR